MFSMITMFAPHASHPDPASLRRLCDDLGARATATAEVGPWQSGAFRSLAETGALAGFVPAADGGAEAHEAAILEMLAAIAARCLTTALALTQWAAGCRLIAGGTGAVRAAWLPDLARGTITTTVGIAQLSTSRRHLAAPALSARRVEGVWRLTGVCPWVTGADSSDTIVTGAATDDGGHVFFIVQRNAPGLTVSPPMHLLALTGSRTSSVGFSDVAPAAVIEPRADGGVRTGGLATTALALGSTRASLALLDGESASRAALEPITSALRAEADGIAARLRRAAAGGDGDERDRLRADANSLVVRAAQAALTATKGAGFVVGHPAERLVREAHFFLVWSCPQTVAGIALCDLARHDL